VSNSLITTQTVIPPGTSLDAEKLAAAGPAGEDLFRERIQITGSILAQISAVLQLPPIGSDYGLAVRVVASNTGTTTSVASSAANVTLLAANTARLGAAITNDGNKILYVKCGATASTTSFTHQLGAGEYWEIPFGYTGILDGIWSAANGNARVTEFS
jgi:hypothetical protein